MTVARTALQSDFLKVLLQEGACTFGCAMLTSRLPACCWTVLQGEGLKVLLQEGAEKGSWPKDFAAKHKFSADPVIPLPDVSQVELQPDSDEFIVIATDGLWDCMPAGEACRFARCVEAGGTRWLSCSMMQGLVAMVEAYPGRLGTARTPAMC